LCTVEHEQHVALPERGLHRPAVDPRQAHPSSE
jgi:hypothetical protein